MPDNTTAEVATAHDLRTIASLTSFPYTAVTLNNLADTIDTLREAVKPVQEAVTGEEAWLAGCRASTASPHWADYRIDGNDMRNLLSAISRLISETGEGNDR